MKNLIQELQQFGFSDYEARIYATLAEHSPANATLLAKKNNLSRSSVYTTLNQLIAKGVVGTTFKNNVKQFIAEGPEALEQLIESEKTLLEKKTDVLAGIQEQLNTLSNNTLHVPTITFFEGQEGLKKIYLSMMRQAQKNSTLYLLRDEFVWEDEWNFIFKNPWRKRIDTIKKEKNIQTRLLVNNSTVEKKHASVYRSQKRFAFRYLPQAHMIHRFAIYMVDDIVSIFSIEKNNLVGIQMVNQHFAKNFIAIFDGLWKSAKK